MNEAETRARAHLARPCAADGKERGMTLLTVVTLLTGGRWERGMCDLVDLVDVLTLLTGNRYEKEGMTLLTVMTSLTVGLIGWTREGVRHG
jgi:hypothetical protein